MASSRAHPAAIRIQHCRDSPDAQGPGAAFYTRNIINFYETSLSREQDASSINATREPDRAALVRRRARGEAGEETRRGRGARACEAAAISESLPRKCLDPAS